MAKGKFAMQLASKNRMIRDLRSEADGFSAKRLMVGVAGAGIGGAARAMSGNDDADIAVGLLALGAAFATDRDDLLCGAIGALGRTINNKAKERVSAMRAGSAPAADIPT